VLDFEEHLTDARRVIVAFSATPHRFEWGRTLRELGASHLLLRDSTEWAYSRGINGVGDRDDIVRYLKAFAQDGCRVTTLGASTGAYGALLYGQLAGIDQVIAISPLTGRDTDDFDPKYHAQLIDPHHPIPDLRQFFWEEGPVPRVRAFISDGDGCELDQQMAERIGVKEITLVPGYAHGDLARGMLDQGMFAELFQ